MALFLSVQDGVCRKTINRRRAVESITWFPGGEGMFHWGEPTNVLTNITAAFMSVEGSEVVKLVRSSISVTNYILIIFSTESQWRGHYVF